jgi:hypothetical protein
MGLLPIEEITQTEVEKARDEDKLERLCLDFDEDCVGHRTPPFGSYRKCWDYDRSSGFCPFCIQAKPAKKTS